MRGTEQNHLAKSFGETCLLIITVKYVKLIITMLYTIQNLI